MIIIDSNIWIFGEVINTSEHVLAVKGYKKYLETDKVATTPIITSEVFHKLSILFGRDAAYSRVNDILRNPSIEWLNINRETAIEGIKLAKETSVRINDALIAQQALENKAKVFTDNVKDFRKIKGLGIIPLR